MNQTANYQLSQWESTDRILMSDFNSDNAKLDEALGTLAQTVTGHTTALAQKGNCQLYYQSYTGNGATSRTFTFPKQPKLVILRGDAYLVVASPNVGMLACYSTNGYGETGSVTWYGNSVTMTMPSATFLCNTSGLACDLFAWIAADE